MKKIVLRQLKDNWRLSMGTGSRKRNSVGDLYIYVERKIGRMLALDSKGKTAIRVIYRDNTHNESINSSNVKYLMYSLGSFLEDYLAQKTLLKIERKYSDYGQG
jgi:hypothetical protein